MRIRSASCGRERPFQTEWFRCVWPAPSPVTMEVLTTANMVLQDGSGGRDLSFATDKQCSQGGATSGWPDAL